MKKKQRPFIVFASLVGGLTFTSALLLALAPAPLSPDASSSLFAVEAPSFDVVFDTQVAPISGRWKNIYVHHSAGPAGNATSLARSSSVAPDHFVIGNGNGAADGEIQIGQRWNVQQPAGTFPGVAQIDSTCISICLIGDFDKTVPTANQVRRLTQLITTLQGRLQIPGQNVLLVSNAREMAGIGRYFPAAAFRQQILK